MLTWGKTLDAQGGFPFPFDKSFWSYSNILTSVKPEKQTPVICLYGRVTGAWRGGGEKDEVSRANDTFYDARDVTTDFASFSFTQGAYFWQWCCGGSAHGTILHFLRSPGF